MFRKMIFLLLFPVSLCSFTSLFIDLCSARWYSLYRLAEEGAKGVAYTVIEGDEVALSRHDPQRDALSQKSPQPHPGEGFRPRDRANGGIAAGMSGSRIRGWKLVGAIGYGWSFSEHQMGLVTPIDEMAEIWKWADKVPT